MSKGGGGAGRAGRALRALSAEGKAAKTFAAHPTEATRNAYRSARLASFKAVMNARKSGEIRGLSNPVERRYTASHTRASKLRKQTGMIGF